MSYCESHVVPITVDGSGDATAFTSPVTGIILTVIYTKTDFANGVDFGITTETTLQTIWDEDSVDAAKTVAPRQATHSTAGAASLYVAAGTAVNDYIYACNERVKIVIENGGVSKSGTITVIVGG